MSKERVRSRTALEPAVAKLDWSTYPIRNCFTQHKCRLCHEPIEFGQTYVDGGGPTRRAHILCARIPPEQRPLKSELRPPNEWSGGAPLLHGERMQVVGLYLPVSVVRHLDRHLKWRRKQGKEIGRSKLIAEILHKLLPRLQV